MGLLEQIQALPGVWKVVVAVVVVIVVSIKLFGKDETKGMKLPPGPKPLPLVGNMNVLVGDTLPKKLAELAWKMNWPIMSFKLVNKQRVFVVSDPQITKQVLVSQGQVFASRSPPTFAQRYMIKDEHQKPTGVLFTPSGHTWQTNRKLMTMGQLQHRKTHGDSFIIELLQVLYREIETGVGALERNGEQSFEVRTMICRVFLLRVFLVFMFGPGAEKYGEELNSLNDMMFYCLDMSEFAKWFIPIFEPLFDLYWGKVVTRRTMNKKFDVLRRIFADRESYGGVKQWSFCDLLDEAQKNGEIDKSGSMHLLDEVIFAGQETTAKAIEGAIKELASHPDVQKKIQDEIDEVVGKNRPMKLEDVENLPYLQAFIKECFRLHRTLTILVPHMNVEKVKLAGYDIPKNSSIWINVWAMAHNPAIYPDPMVLKPERFLGRKDVGFNGEDPNYIVFGAGRRMCPGVPLALTSTYMIVGSIAQRYHITLPSDWTKDSKTVFGFIPKERALEVCLRKRVGF